MNRKMMRLAIEGQGLVEYALILLLVAIAVVAAVTAFGGAVGEAIDAGASAFP